MAAVRTFLARYPLVTYALALCLLLFLLKWLQWKLLIQDNATEVYIGLIALVFTLLGVWISRQLARPRVERLIVEKEIFIDAGSGTVNREALERLNLSSREQEVLQLLAGGMSNAEIAGSLFLSLSTVKTHVSSLLVKLDVKSRAKAIDKAKRERLTA